MSVCGASRSAIHAVTAVMKSAVGSADASRSTPRASAAAASAGGGSRSRHTTMHAGSLAIIVAIPSSPPCA